MVAHKHARHTIDHFCFLSLDDHGLDRRSTGQFPCLPVNHRPPNQCCHSLGLLVLLPLILEKFTNSRARASNIRYIRHIRHAKWARHRFGGPLFVRIELMATKIKRATPFHRQRNTRLISATGHISRHAIPFRRPLRHVTLHQQIAALNGRHNRTRTKKKTPHFCAKKPSDVVSSICRPIKWSFLCRAFLFFWSFISFVEYSIRIDFLKVCSLSIGGRRRYFHVCAPVHGQHDSSGFMMRRWALLCPPLH